MDGACRIYLAPKSNPKTTSARSERGKEDGTARSFQAAGSLDSRAKSASSFSIDDRSIWRERLKIASIAGLLAQAISLIQTIRNARESITGATKAITVNEQSLQRLLEYLELVQSEKALQTRAVSDSIQVIIERASDVRSIFDTIATRQKKSSSRQLLHAMTKAGTDEKDLNEALNQLDRAKVELGLRIQLANVGVTRSLRDGIVATMPVTQRTNANVTRVLGAGLRIAKLLEESTRQPKYGEVLLDEDEIETLGLAGSMTGPNELAWSGNETLDQAKQLNGPAGEKIWQSGRKMTWEKNIARGESKQINGPVSDAVLMDFFA